MGWCDKRCFNNYHRKALARSLIVAYQLNYMPFYFISSIALLFRFGTKHAVTAVSFFVCAVGREPVARVKCI